MGKERKLPVGNQPVGNLIDVSHARHRVSHDEHDHHDDHDEHDHDHHDDDHDHHHSHETDELSERRNKSDRERDRRVIARISIPEMRPVMGLLRQLCRFGTGFCVVYMGAVAAGQLFPAPTWENLPKSTFVIVVMLVVAINFVRVSQSIGSYLQNESKGRLTTVVEHMMHLLFVVITLGAILGSVQILTWIK